MKDHRAEKQQLEPQRPDIKISRIGAGAEAKVKIERAGDEQDLDGYPAERLELFAPALERADALAAGQGARGRREDKEKKCERAGPDHRGEEMQPQHRRGQKNLIDHNGRLTATIRVSHLQTSPRLCLQRR